MAEARTIYMDPKNKLVELLRAAERELHDAAGDAGQRVTETQRLELAVSVLTSRSARPYMDIINATKASVIEDVI